MVIGCGSSHHHIAAFLTPAIACGAEMSGFKRELWGHAYTSPNQHGILWKKADTDTVEPARDAQFPLPRQQMAHP